MESERAHRGLVGEMEFGYLCLLIIKHDVSVAWSRKHLGEGEIESLSQGDRNRDFGEGVSQSESRNAVLC